jgi:hypothetical protein
MRLAFADLNALHDQLSSQLFHQQLTLATYVAEWDQVLAFAGWTLAEYGQEVDRGWTTERRPVRAFLC